MNALVSALVIGSLLLQSSIQSGGGGTQRIAAAPSSGGTPTLVQTCDYFVNFGGGPATCTLSGVSAGNAIVVGVSSSVAIAGATVAGTSLTAVDSVTGGPYAADYIYANAAGGPITISVAMAAVGKTRIIASEFSGVAANPLGGHNTVSCTSGCNTTSINSTAFTQAANDMVWSMCQDTFGNTVTPGTSPTAATRINTISWGTPAVLAEYFVVPTAGSTYGSCTTGTFSSVLILSLALKHA